MLKHLSTMASKLLKSGNNSPDLVVKPTQSEHPTKQSSVRPAQPGLLSSKSCEVHDDLEVDD